jgi:signal transduction histidine kinase
MTRVSRARPAAGRAWATAAVAARGLIRVLGGADAAPAWRRRSSWQRPAAYAALTVATLVAWGASLASLRDLNLFVPAAVVFNAPSPPLFKGPPPVKGPPALRPGGIGKWAHVRAASAASAPHFTSVAQVNMVAPGGPRPGPLAAVSAQHGLVGLLPALLQSPTGSMVLAVLIALAVVAPLPLAARYPLLGWRLAWLGLLLVPKAHVSWLGAWPWDPVQIVALLAVFCAAGIRHDRPVLWWMWALTLVPWWLQAASGVPGVVVGALGTVSLTAAAVAVDAVSSRRRAQLALADQAERTELEQARRAVLEERARIARELHDVVAHHMSLIAVRAETAPYRLAGLSGPALAEFASLSGGAREALADMRRLLGVLRHEEPAELAPQPQLADLPQLIGTARRAGMGVALSQVITPAQVPPPVGVCAYRIVQESLSNASRHAPGAPVTVTIGHDDDADAVVLQVANGPPATASGNAPPDGKAPPAGYARAGGHGTATRQHAVAAGPGHGLSGMRERVALLGGSLSAGPSPDGGFLVSAVLPLAQAA